MPWPHQRGAAQAEALSWLWLAAACHWKEVHHAAGDGRTPPARGPVGGRWNASPCQRQHLPLYLAELDYKYNTRKATDGARTTAGIRLVEGKRLMYRDPVGT
jgi:hypothetical protein